MRRSIFPIAIMLASVAATSLAAQAATMEYQTTLDRLTSAGPARIFLAVEVVTLPQWAGEGPDPLLVAETARITALLAGKAGVTLEGSFDSSSLAAAELASKRARPPSTTAPSAAEEAAQKKLSAEHDAKLAAMAPTATRILIVRIINLRSGKRDLYETTARLLEAGSLKEVTRDSGWTSSRDGKPLARFVNGWRLK
ncbi:MAG: hypothetical protein ACOYM2_02435 [Rectinemataceae bacterium]